MEGIDLGGSTQPAQTGEAAGNGWVEQFRAACGCRLYALEAPGDAARGVLVRRIGQDGAADDGGRAEKVSQIVAEKIADRIADVGEEAHRSSPNPQALPGGAAEWPAAGSAAGTAQHHARADPHRWSHRARRASLDREPRRVRIH